MRNFNLALLFFLSSVWLLGQPDVSGITQPAGPANPTIVIANASSTGTTLNTLTKLTGAPSTAVITATTDTGGIVGVCISGCGTTGNATLQIAGLVSLIMDGATTAGHYVQNSTGTGGDGTDSGATYPTSGQVIARVLSSNVGAGTYTVDLFPAEIKASSGGAAGATLFSTTGSTTVVATAATTLIGTVTGTTTIPANTFTAGQVLEIAGQGFYSTPATATSLTISILVAGSVQVTTGAVVQIPSVTTGVWRLRCIVTTRTAGAGGTQIANCIFEETGATLTPGDAPMQLSAAWSVNTTITNTIDLQATWSTAVGAPTITSTNVAAWIPGAPVTSVNGATGAVTVTPFFQTLTAPSSASFTQENFNTGAGVTTTQTNNSSPVTSINLLQHDPGATKNIAALDKAVIASKSFTLTVGLSIAPSNSNNTAYGLYLSDGGAGPNIILFGMQAGPAEPGVGSVLDAFTFTNFTTFGVSIFAGGPPSSWGPLMWLRVKEDASHRTYYTSSDGINFAQAFQEAVTAHFTTTRYGFGLGLQAAAAANPDSALTLYSFTETNP